MSLTIAIDALAKKLGIDYVGEPFDVVGINTLQEATAQEISFLENPKYLSQLKETKAGAVLIRPDQLSLLPEGVGALVSEEPYLKMAEATHLFAKPLIRPHEKTIIALTAQIGERVHIGNGAIIGENVHIFDGAFIGENVHIGDNTIIYPNVTLYNDTIVGKFCIIHANSVIGSDGFGYAHTKTGEHIKIIHNGCVILEDDVEIGSNSSIDRAVFGTTRIQSGTKIDNLVQIGHNCDIGAGSILVAQSGISGSTRLGRNVVMGGQSATAGHLSIGDFATVAARGGVTKSIEGGKVYSGFPLMLHSDWLKLQAKIQKFFKKG